MSYLVSQPVLLVDDEKPGIKRKKYKLEEGIHNSTFFTLKTFVNIFEFAKFSFSIYLSQMQKKNI